MGKKPLIIVFFGRSGSGKGTQAKLLQKDLGLDYLPSGDIVREVAEKETFTGKKIKKVLQGGERVPTAIMFKLWASKIGLRKKRGLKKGLIIDGSPRSALEARLMDALFHWYEWSNVKIVLLDISEDVAFNRLSKRRVCRECKEIFPWLEKYKKMEKCPDCGGDIITRSDDYPEAIRARLEYYKEDVVPAIKYYKKQNRLIKINGNQSIENVYQEILNKLSLKSEINRF